MVGKRKFSKQNIATSSCSSVLLFDLIFLMDARKDVEFTEAEVGVVRGIFNP